MKKLVCLLALCVATSGCVLSQATDGTSIDATTLEGITPGRSTRADVTRLLGPPDEIINAAKEHDPLFEKVFIYKRSRTRNSALFLVIFSTYRSDTKYDQVAVFFDERGVVEHVGSDVSAATASYGMPF